MARLVRRAAPLLALGAGLVGVPSGAAAAAGVPRAVGTITVYSDITAGQIVGWPQRGIWAAQGSKITRISVNGKVLHSYPVPGTASDLVFQPRTHAGARARIWFDEGSGSIGEMLSNGKVTSYAVPGCSQPSPGSTGFVWLVCNGGADAGRLNLKTGVVKDFTLPAGTQTRLIRGPGNLMYFGQQAFIGSSAYEIGRIGPAGRLLSPLDLPGLNCTSGFAGLAMGRDATIWFDGFADEEHCFGGSFGYVTADGSAAHVFQPDQGMFLQGMAMAPDGSMWMGDSSPYEAIWRATSSGSATKYVTGTETDDPTTGPDGRIWFLEGNVLAAITTR